MFSINDTVLYGANGVCRITDICQKEFSGVIKDYYILTPLSNETMTIFVPINWILDDNERKEHYRTILSSSNRLEILNMIREIYIHKQKQLKNGKKMHLSDEQLMKEAERLLYSEFSLVLNIRADEVPKFISSRIN